MKRFLLASGLITLPAVAAGFWWTQRAHAQRIQASVTPAEAPRVEVIRPAAANGQGGALPARTAPAEEAFIFSRATGVIAERRVDLGDVVQVGDILALVEAPEIGPQVAGARAGLARAEANAALAELAVQRARTLRESGDLSSEEADERETRLQVAQAEVATARAALTRLEAIQAFQTIRAPFTGTIVARQGDRGDRVNGDASAADAWLFHLVRLNELRVEVDVTPAQALRLADDTEASLTFAEFPGEKFATRVKRRAPFVDRASGTVRVELLLDNADRRVPAGLLGSVAFGPATTTALVLPVNTLVIRDGQSMVAIVTEGKVRFAPVRLGRNLGSRVEILSGLTPDASVVLSPNALLREGDSVSVATSSTAQRG